MDHVLKRKLQTTFIGKSTKTSLKIREELIVPTYLKKNDIAMQNRTEVILRLAKNKSERKQKKMVF